MPFQFKPDPDQDNLVIRSGMSAQQKPPHPNEGEAR
ncbi:hypothetical protein FIU85_09810 [Roseovarius sp. THAF8]|nr:hypothetical protein FIU85_09810 [Roseovarius sp. THAF8]